MDELKSHKSEDRKTVPLQEVVKRLLNTPPLEPESKKSPRKPKEAK